MACERTKGVKSYKTLTALPPFAVFVVRMMTWFHDTNYHTRESELLFLVYTAPKTTVGTAPFRGHRSLKSTVRATAV